MVANVLDSRTSIAAISMVRYEILMFAAARDLAGTDRLMVELDPPVVAGDILAAIAVCEPELRPLLGSCRLAVNREFVANDAPVESVAEIALIPPVSGG